MGYGLMGWAISTDWLGWIAGSRDEQLIADFQAACGDRLARIDEDFEYAIEAGAPRAAEAFAQIVRGEQLSGHGFMYAYAIEALCDWQGEFLPNGSLMPIGTSWGDTFDAEIRPLGVTEISLSKLCYGRLPLAIPHPDDFPGFGHLTPPQVRAAAAELRGVSYHGDEYNVAEALADLTRWCEIASATDLGIVSFFH